jgi:hypothetical protein
MGEESAGIASSGRREGRHHPGEAHHISVDPTEDRCGTKSALGEGKGSSIEFEKEPAAWVAGFVVRRRKGSIAITLAFRGSSYLVTARRIFLLTIMRVFTFVQLISVVPDDHSCVDGPFAKMILPR